jgi:hypothetical protein
MRRDLPPPMKTAEGKAETAADKANTAGGKAQTAEGKAQTAEGKAQTPDAEGNAQTAEGKAQTPDAEGSASTAEGKAETTDAEGNASTAEGKAETTDAEGTAKTAAEKPKFPTVHFNSFELGKVKVKTDRQDTICTIRCAPTDGKKEFQIAQLTPKEPVTMVHAYDICQKGAKLYADGGKGKEEIKQFLLSEIKALAVSLQT